MVKIYNTGNYNDFVNNMPESQNNDLTQNSGGVGKLKIFTYTGNAALPVNNAVIRIFQKDSNGNETLVYDLLSGFDGETEELLFDTPAIENSLSPENQAFSIFYADIFHPDYVPVKGVSLQVFPNTLTVLPLNLQPKSLEVI